MPEWHTPPQAPTLFSPTPPITRASAQVWLDAYVHAWKTYDEAEVAALWSADAVWHYPWDVRATCREDITSEWMSERDAFVGERFDAHYEPVAIDGNTVVVHGRTVYWVGDTHEVDSAYDNVWILRFAEDGTCSEFHEWYAGLPEDDPLRAIPNRR